MKNTVQSESSKGIKRKSNHKNDFFCEGFQIIFFSFLKKFKIIIKPFRLF